MSISKHTLDTVFRAYDIRGEEKDGLNEEFFSHLGKGFVTFLKAKKISVGRDMRPESLVFQKAFIKSAVERGCDVIDIGEVGTEMHYFAVGSNLELDGGVTITASHNPAGWNGCKMVRKGAAAISEDTGLLDIKSIIANEEYLPISETKGSVEEVDIYPEYKKKVFEFLGDPSKIKPLKIVVDAGNGIGGKLFDYLFSELPLEVTKMYFEPDGSFPNHVPDPLKEENVVEIKKKTLELNADLGIAIDGDADRVVFIDKQGRSPSGVYTGALLARHFLKLYPGGFVIHDPRLIWSMQGQIEKHGGKSVIIKAGHSFFKEKMKETGGIFAAEVSSHFYYKDFYNADAGLVTVAVMLRMISEGLDFTKEIDYFYENYPDSGEVNYLVDDVEETLAKIESEFQDAKIDHIDGVSIEYDDWRFNLRPSNTQPLLRLNVEAKTKVKVVEKFRLVEQIIGKPRDNEPALEELK